MRPAADLAPNMSRQGSAPAPAALRESLRIAGERVGGERVIEVRNPYTGAIVGTVPKASVDEVRRAYALAKRFRPTLSRHDRYRILHRAAELLG
jgi:acyl-CoA reductase-like NAD-dependent aldehyde dehydrogenase